MRMTEHRTVTTEVVMPATLASSERMKSGLREATKTMPRSSITFALSDAKRMLEAGEAKAASIGIAYNIAVVDAGGALVAFTRQDGGLLGSIDLAISKAITARLFDKRTSDLARMAQP